MRRRYNDYTHTTDFTVLNPICLLYTSPCPVYPYKVRPLRGWLKENHPRFAAVFSFAKPCGYGHGTGRQARNKNTGSRSRTCLTDKNTKVMKILNEEHFENVRRYAESIGDTSLQKCLERLKSWEENPDCPCEISLYYDHAPYSFGFTPVSYTHLWGARHPCSRNIFLP